MNLGGNQPVVDPTPASGATQLPPVLVAHHQVLFLTVRKTSPTPRTTPAVHRALPPLAHNHTPKRTKDVTYMYLFVLLLIKMKPSDARG